MINKKWEYGVSEKIVKNGHPMIKEENMDPWGEDGWELVSVVMHKGIKYGDMLMFFWKREKK